MQVIFNDHKNSVSVYANEIIYLEAKSNYTKLHLCNSRSYISVKCLKKFEQLLDGSSFFRVHRSFLINADKLNSMDINNFLSLEENNIVPISRRRRLIMKEIFNKINQ